MTARWLLLLHRLPTEPAYVRVKVGRLVAQIGAVALKSAVYVLPDREACRESFEWIRTEIAGQGGDATLLRAEMVEGLSDQAVEDMFRRARDVDYRELAEQARAVTTTSPHATARTLAPELAKLEKRLSELIAIDFFDAPQRGAAAAIIAALRERVSGSAETGLQPIRDPRAYRKRTWVTRRNVHVDRIASAWLILRFIDRDARFRFVAPERQPKATEIGFDMFGAELTHHDDLCTFEVLRHRFELSAPGLVALGEIVHDLDLEDAKYARPECAGVAAVIAGLARHVADDRQRIELGTHIFDALLAGLATARKQRES